jgi:hypothetical protein
MPFLPLVVDAEYDGDYRVRLRFNDGRSKLVDLLPLLVGPVFAPIRSQSEFQRFFIEAGTLGWPAGADLAPEALYALPEIDIPAASGRETSSSVRAS